MKKIIPIALSLFLIFLVYEFIVVFFVKQYNYSYSFNSTNNTKYDIDEKYSYKNKEHLYDIKIKGKNNTYIYTLNHNYHKSKLILEELYSYNENNLECVLPVFKDNVYSNIECFKDGKIVSYEYLKEKNENIEEIDKFIKETGKINKHPNRETKKITGTATELRYYKDFISDYNVIVWNYKGVFTINKDKQDVKEFINFDIYDSSYIGKSDDKLYVLYAASTDPTFETIYTVEYKDGTVDKMDVIDYELSTNIYFNGSYKNEMYMLDCNSNKQYKILTKKEQLEETSKENKIKYFDGIKLEDKPLDSISNNNILFNENKVNKKITKLYNTEDIKESNNHYYFKDNDGNFYLSFEDEYKNSVLLFQLKDLKEWTVVDDTIFGIYQDKLYAYNESYGLYPIIVYNEFNYHTKNMYGVAKK